MARDAFLKLSSSFDSVLEQQPSKRKTSTDMRKLDGELKNVCSANVVRLGKRSFHFLILQGVQRRLLVIELTLGERVTKTEVDTGVDTGIVQTYLPGCCQLGDEALVMFGVENTTDVFAALVSIDPGELTRESIHVKRLEMTGLESWGGGPYLAQIGETRLWGSFFNSDEVWICKLRGNTLEWVRSATRLPTESGFGAPPLCLPDGRLLAAGALPLSANIYIITAGDDLSFKEVGKFSGAGRYSVSTVLLGERFVIGFGGWAGNDINDMWIFDLETRNSSSIEKQGDWHPATWWPVLEIQDNTLYIIGGGNSVSTHSIPLISLSGLIQNGSVRLVFCEALGVPSVPAMLFSRSNTLVFHPLRL